jgi:dTDP-4-dehydrorhamnose reductase
VRVAVIGSSGQLGSHLVRVLNDEKYDVISLQHADIECGDPESVQVVLRSIEPEVVINCAAFTDVDRCQEQPAEAFRVNALGALYVAQACARGGSLCVYISTDFIFDGEKGESYTEDDCPNPINVYGASKHAGEMLLRQACPQWLIVRMASLFGKTGNFVDTIIRKAQTGASLRIVDDIYMSPTYAYDASRALEQLIRQRGTGIFHLANTGRCSWYELAKRTFEIVGISPVLESIHAHDYPYHARRPKDSSLRRRADNDGLGPLLRPWQHALEAYLDVTLKS